MQTAYDVSDFLQLDNIQDMRALLDEKGSELPVLYPRSSEVPEPKGQNFEWFMGNKRKKKYTLQIAAQDDHGLPLIDRKGEFVRK